ncbi:cytochrome c oxidase, cbb3-type, CcoQ subunit [Campylobacter pinnipediorum]|uniref:Cytochrome c oxidase, cbb3-type, CcoQ subunit n=1 Tax=Campylobacter pinnipediorum subsp. pinnipediorum TaxID=1660067 RepID=A0AAX0LD85_9BACT|nr:cytochrome c oxidase, cbb3-type, CcoQ subunit [Campylobacter pinnipediorum]AQW80640.1 cytochrome c oxidase CcoNOPQ, cbb3-type, subunit IV [Campylobacter pinnipediorum subsp. pinnipediorum]AQW82308.1 cytochrome c oxidase CcoNOPQ, cbb3-type, subunit IV [Campylobacter pinnipediorum subsp. pinnipediorum]AQW83985.1 cytochrome c oxidase CcoNOPQ, cbb3-type, subunit IV [Campylobacter pinnipediorum subsp. pinnipediorum]AQW85627.1 cytochrome c oxidase CcoNOPQ, cbb3-type, subunit IV [Campylobacter pinn
MDMQTIRELQAYGFFFFTLSLVLVLYGYFYHLYKSERTGRRNYEKYSNLALDDDLNSAILEQNISKKGL